MKYEYLIVWKREAFPPNRVLRQTLKGALMKVEHLKWDGRIDVDGSMESVTALPRLEWWYIRRREVWPWEDFEL